MLVLVGILVARAAGVEVGTTSVATSGVWLSSPSESSDDGVQAARAPMRTAIMRNLVMLSPCILMLVRCPITYKLIY